MTHDETLEAGGRASSRRNEPMSATERQQRNETIAAMHLRANENREAGERCGFILIDEADESGHSECGRRATHHGGGGAAPEILVCSEHAKIVNRDEGAGTVERLPQVLNVRDGDKPTAIDLYELLAEFVNESACAFPGCAECVKRRERGADLCQRFDPGFDGGFGGGHEEPNPEPERADCGHFTDKPYWVRRFHDSDVKAAVCWTCYDKGVNEADLYDF